MVVALGLTAVALARPQFPGRSRPAKQRGLDLVVALDFSRSMLATDIYPSRLERSKRELGELLATLGNDRVGVIAFAGETLSYPPTTDYAAIEAVLAGPSPVGHARGRHRHRPRHPRLARPAGRPARQGGRVGRDARAGDPAAHRRRGQRQRAAGSGGRSVEAGREDLHRRRRVALRRADSRIRRARQGDRLRQGRGRQIRHLAARRADAGRARAAHGRRGVLRGFEALRRRRRGARAVRAEANRERRASGAAVRRGVPAAAVRDPAGAVRGGRGRRAAAAQRRR